jgi:myo-inositol-1(or 4)-monophosphatase
MERKALTEEICKKAGEIILAWYSKENQMTSKSETDFVLSADLEAEKYILKAIQQNFPNDQIFSEEAGVLEGNGEYSWIVDPLDGTANFQAHIPYFCVSIAIMQHETIVMAFVYDPINHRMYSAEKSNGSFVNEEKMQVSKTNELKKFFVSYSTSNHKTEAIVDLGSKCFNKILHNCRAIRLQGSSILDLCNLANGTFDGLVKVGANYWDFAAGCLIVEEAGGQVTDFEGNMWDTNSSNILASNGMLHKDLIFLIK